MQRRMKRILLIAFAFLMPFLLAGCSGLLGTPVATPIPPEHLPTVIAQTLEAGRTQKAGAAPSPIAPTQPASQPAEPSSASPTSAEPPTALPETPAEAVEAPTVLAPTLDSAILSPEPALDQATQPVSLTVPDEITATPPPNIPEASIQIFRLGELSRVLSPLRVRAYFQRGSVGPIRVELLGEDGRLLVRQVKQQDANPETWADLTFNLDFQINAAAEVGHLVIRSDDAFGRPLAVNSVNLILASSGEGELNPSDAIYQSIVIQQPATKALIQGGKVLVAGLARTSGAKPLEIQLVAENGSVVGQRLAGVTPSPTGGHGTFSVEVPYTVTTLTSVRLLVFEESSDVSTIAHLSSIEVLLSP